MPVCDARTQNGDRAFSYVVIENIFISGFRKSDPLYYYGVTAKTLAIIASGGRRGSPFCDPGLA
jgi:hypothetical protein